MSDASTDTPAAVPEIPVDEVRHAAEVVAQAAVLAASQVSDRAEVAADAVNNAAISAAEVLSTAFSGVSKEIRGLKALGIRQRNIIRFLFISLAFDILLSCGLGVVAVKASNAAAKAQAASTAAASAQALQHTLCLADNASNARQVVLWNRLIAITPASQKQDPAATATFNAILADTFPQKKC